MDNAEPSSTPGIAEYRCRKCRQVVEVAASVVQEIKGCNIQCSTQSSMIFLDIDHCPEWITQEINRMQWGKGKLHCLKCSGRLGSFDFVKSKVCICGNHELPPLHLLTDRLDIIQKEAKILENEKQPVACSIISSERFLEYPEILTDMATDKASGTLNCSIPHCSNSLLLINSNHTNVEVAENAITVELVSLEKCHQAEKCDTKNNNNSSIQVQCDICNSSSGQVSARSCDIHTKTESDIPNGTVNSEGSGFHTGVKRIRKRNLRRPRRYARYLNDIPNPYMVLHEAGLVEEANIEVTECSSANTEEDKYMTDVDEIVMAEADIPDEWICCICMEMYHKPHSCQPCGHLFCGPCLRKLAETTRRKPVRCPLCRTVIEECCPDSELQCRIGDMFPNIVKERDARMKKIHMLKSSPLPQFSGNPQYTPFPERGPAFNMIYLAFMRSQYVGRLFFLFMLYICHNTLFLISKHIVSFPYTKNQDGFNEFLWGTARLVLMAYILQTIQNQRWFKYIRKFRIGILVFIFIFSETWMRFFVTLIVLFTLI